jgi:hypothetical protein
MLNTLKLRTYQETIQVPESFSANEYAARAFSKIFKGANSLQVVYQPYPICIEVLRDELRWRMR